MSQRNVEVVRRALEAFNRGDLDGALEMYDPQAVFKTLLSGSARSREQLRVVIERREEEIGAVQYHPEEFIDAGQTVVGVVRVINARGRLSGISEQDFAAAPQLAVAWTFRNGLIVGQEMFRSRAEALEAVGPRD
jgi:ketosteroid isomerase-like protein